MDFKYNYLNYSNNKNQEDYTIKPKLVHNSTKFFFNKILKNCNTIKKNNYNLFYNITMFIVFAIILSIILYSKYKGNMSPQQRYQKNTKEKILKLLLKFSKNKNHEVKKFIDLKF